MPPVRVLVVSAWDEARVREAAVEHCADLFVTKPFDLGGRRNGREGGTAPA